MTWQLITCTPRPHHSHALHARWSLLAPCLCALSLLAGLSAHSMIAWAQTVEVSTPQLSAKERAKAAFKKGSQAFAKERWSEALAHFEEAYQAYPVPLMMFNIASTYERLGDLQTAVERYEAFVATGKDSDGDAAARLKVIKERLATWAELRLTSIPSNALVFVGKELDRARGKTPLTLRLPPSMTQSLTLSAEGYLSKTITPRFKPNEKRSLKVELQGEPAFVRVLGTPKEATVKVSGQGPQGPSGLPFTQELSVGVYELEISASGYVPQRRTVTLTPVHSKSAPLVVEVTLSSSEGVALLNLTADQEGALLFIDGKPAGQTPLSSPLKLKQGTHLIELKGAEGGLYSERVVLKAGATQFVDAKLSTGFTFTRQHVGYTLASVGSAALIGGLISGGVALASSGELEECRANFRCGRGQGELDLAQEVRAYSSAADWMMGLGFALAAGGATLILLDSAEGPTPTGPTLTPSAGSPTKASLGLSPTRGGLSAVGGFTF